MAWTVVSIFMYPNEPGTHLPPTLLARSLSRKIFYMRVCFYWRSQRPARVLFRISTHTNVLFYLGSQRLRTQVQCRRCILRGQS